MWKSAFFCVALISALVSGSAQAEPCVSLSSQAQEALTNQVQQLAAPLKNEVRAEACVRLDNAPVADSEIESTACSLNTDVEQLLWLQGYTNCKGEAARKTFEWEIQRAEEKLYRPALAEYERILQNPQGYPAKAVEAARKAVAFYRNIDPGRNMVQAAYTGEGYQRLNQVLRHGPKAAACFRPIVNRLRKEFERYPVYSGEVWRGIGLTETEIQSYRDGETVTWSSFSSTSKRREIAEGFGHYPGKRFMLFKVRSKSCVDISSWNSLEQEVLCFPGTRLRVERHVGTNEIDLFESQPDTRPE